MIIDIELDDVDSYHAEIVAKGVEISCEPKDEPFGQRMMYLYNHDGYNLCSFNSYSFTEKV